MADTLPLINGIAYAWADVTFLIGGVPVIGITKISYNQKQKKDNIYAFGNQPVQRGYGIIEYEASITLLLDEWVRIKNSAPLRNPLKIPPFTVNVLYGNSDANLVKDVLTNFEFLENPIDTSQGDTSIAITIPCIYAGLNE